jgi:hypothetical protein
VRVPGTDDVRRTVLRRQRTRLLGAVGVAVLALAGAFGAYVTKATTAPAYAPASLSARPSAPPSSAATTEASASPSGSPTGEPAAAVDLHLTGPASAVLTASDGHYQGTVSITLRYDGLTPYQQTGIFVTYPAGVQMAVGASAGFGPCLVSPEPDSFECSADPVPAGGGKVSYVIPLTADYAPQPHDLTLSGFRLRVEATGYADPTPSDNAVAIELVLKATG